jgi:hypothetical protein
MARICGGGYNRQVEAETDATLPPLGNDSSRQSAVNDPTCTATLLRSYDNIYQKPENLETDGETWGQEAVKKLGLASA